MIKQRSNSDLQKFYDQSYKTGEAEVFTFFENGKHISEDHTTALAMVDWNGKSVLDVGCGKGFLVKDLMKVCPGLEVFGIDISEYAVMNCEPTVIGRVHHGNATHLPFPDNSFQAVLSINTVHNLDRANCILAVQEMGRVASGRGYIQVDAYRNKEEEQIFLDWVLTARTYGTPEFWVELLREAGYVGDYYWTILEVDPK